MRSHGRIASALYRGVLRLYPRRARDRFGADQLSLFELTWREERPRGSFAILWTIGQLCRGVQSAVSSHLDGWLRASLRQRDRRPAASWRIRHLTALGRDLQAALRALRAAPWYSAGVIAVFAVGLALATVVFAVVDGVLFKPLPYPRADELFLVRVDVSGAPRVEAPPVGAREADAWAEAVPDAPLTRVGRSATPIGAIASRSYYAAGIDDRFFDVLGARPWLGGFIADDFIARPPGVDRDRFPRALISYGLWITATGGNPEILGRPLALNRAGDRGVRVAGVLPKDFVFPLNVVDHTTSIRPTDLLLPMQADTPENRDFPDYLVLTRIEQGSDLAAVRERLRRATLELTRSPPAIDIHHDAQRRPPYDLVELEAVPALLGRHERPTFALVATATGLLLVLVCVNLAGLTAARSLHRHRDLVIRRALGATGWNLARGLFGELLVLAVAAVAIALLVSPALLRWTIALLPETVTLLKEPGLDARVFVTTALLAFASAVVVIVWPALMATRVSAFSASGRLDAASTRLGRRSGLFLLSAQAAVGFVLVTAGGLTLASIAAAWRSDVGYQRDRVVIFEAFFKEWAATATDHEHVIALHDALRQVPGVTNVAATNASLRFLARDSRVWSGVKPVGATAAPAGVASRYVSAEFFDVMSLPFVDGEAPSRAEWSTDRLAVVSESTARVLWPDRSAIGQQLVPVRPDPEPPQAWRVVGVVEDARYQAVDREPVADVYLPDRIERGRYGAFFLVKTSEPPKSVIPALAALAHARGFWTETVMPLDDALFATMRPRFLPAWLFGSLGVVAVVVLAAGVFGLLAMSAAQRTRELVIRVALGATSARVLRLLARDQIGAVVAGITAGAVVSFWATEALSAHLYGVTAREPAIWIAAAVMMLVVAALGAAIPAARAARVDPAQALRVE